MTSHFDRIWQEMPNEKWHKIRDSFDIVWQCRICGAVVKGIEGEVMHYTEQHDGS